MKLLRLTKCRDDEPCYINPSNVQYFAEYSLAQDDGKEEMWTEVIMIGGKVSVLESADEIAHMLRWIDKS